MQFVSFRFVALAAVKRTVWEGKGKIRKRAQETVAAAQARDRGGLSGKMIANTENGQT